MPNHTMESGADSIRCCYISEKREIISEFELPLSTFPEDECERYFLENDLITAIDEDLKIERQYCKECYKEIYGDDEEWICN